MGGTSGWDFDPRRGMLADQGRAGGPAPERLERLTFGAPPKEPMPRGMKLALWLTAIWAFGVLLVVLAHRFVESLGCMFDPSDECRTGAANKSTNITLLGFVLLVVLSVIAIVLFELRRDRRR
ncbi:MAG: hypothetical protein FJW95_08615 [Actinobacteria bacterium]|nr:hypothetical protein [Actinomycetota bacterium]